VVAPSVQITTRRNQTVQLGIPTFTDAAAAAPAQNRHPSTEQPVTSPAPRP
jgi:hypothetical protein